MKRLLLAAIVVMAATAPAWAQSSSATGTGVGVAGSTSSSQAISGQGGTGIAAITSNSSVPANQTLKNVPSVFAPGLTAAGLETCLGSVSAGGAFVGTGISFGTTVPDPACAARLDAQTLWSMGLKKAAGFALMATSIARCRRFATSTCRSARRAILPRRWSPPATRRRMPPRSSLTPAATFGSEEVKPNPSVLN